MITEPPAISIQDVSVTYRTTFEKVPTLKGALARIGRKRKIRTVEAVKHVSFDVANGTVLGLIGANGAGKSTLLRTVAGILPPSDGRIEVRGKVSTLLSLGVGFNKSLSGRENIYLGGLAAGLEPDEIQERYDEIVAFANIGDFIDYPMKTYSSGMYGRLAFAVAVHMDPDILLVDEALSAGDAAFKRKAAQKMRELCTEARTIMLVSHGMSSIKELADECVWLHKGELRAQGEPDTVIKQYTTFMEVGEEATTLEDV